jgi:competence protein ComEA
MSARLLKKTVVFSSLAAGLALAAGAAALAQQTATPPVGARAKAKLKAAQAAAKSTTPLDLNTASLESMVETLPGVGEATAKKIIAGRPYRSLEDLARAGIPPRTINQIRSMVTFTPAAAAKGQAKAVAKTREMPERKATAPAAGATAPTTTTAAAPAGKIDLNHATVEELQTLPGIGPAHAAAIIAARPFRSPQDLSRVRGLSRRAEFLQSRVTVTPMTATASETTAAAATRPAAKAAAPKVATTRPAAGTRAVPGTLVNINTASKAQLDVLPGIGPVRAQAIIDARPFKSKEEIMKVKGIKQVEFGKIKDMITVE